MPVIIKTGRGAYSIRNAAPVERAGNLSVITLSLDRADGIEKVALRCRIPSALLETLQADAIERAIARIAPWIEREFETIRESALKTIRTEHRLLELSFDPPSDSSGNR
jgi:hypothetical protein